MRQGLSDLLAKSGDIPFLTVHHVEVAPDYSTASVRYSLLDESPAGLERAEEYFRENSAAIRHRLAARLQMRSTPRLDFVYASEMRQAERIDRLVGRIAQAPRE